MTNAMTMNGFVEVSQLEMMEIDGGAWLKALFTVVGAVVGVAISVSNAVTLVAGCSITSSCTSIGCIVGGALEGALGL